MAHQVPSYVTREAVLEALAACDELGEARFLAAHGFGQSKRYRIRYRGRSYPSKAILGVAAGLTARQFSGGAAHTVRVLVRLGFHVRDGAQVEIPAHIRDLVKTELGAFPYEPWTAGAVDPVAYFASGVNTAANIRAFGAIGHDIGVAFPELSEASIEALVELVGTDVQVFVDSGAFSEVKFTAEGPRVVKPLDHAHWLRMLETYRRLGEALGDQLHVVAPDMVGHQKETLERLTRYADALRELDAMGVRVLVPVQKGNLTQVEFWKACLEVLGDGHWIPALPCKKAATTVDEAIAFAEATKPTAIHLLGLGTRNRAAAAFIDGIAAVSASLVQCDSCLLAAHCGKGRRYGTARDRGFELFGKAANSTARITFQVVLAFGSWLV